jgi:large subunit ribosomal protein L7Ae
MPYFFKKTNIQKNRIIENEQHLKKFEIKKKNFKIGRDIQPKRDLSRFVKWPLYIQVQRERKILCQRLKIPPIINQFSRSLDKNMVKQLMFTLLKYRTVSAEGISNKNIIYIKHGINTITNLIQKKKALFIVIANDVNPIELVVWLPTLCQKMDIPFCIIKDKSRLGKLVNRKATSCITVTSLLDAEKDEVRKLIDCFRLNFNNRYEDGKKRWGGSSSSFKTKI